MKFNITFKTIFEYILKKLVLCIQIRFVSTEKTTRIASRASCLSYQQDKYYKICTFLKKICKIFQNFPEMCYNDLYKSCFQNYLYTSL